MQNKEIEENTEEERVQTLVNEITKNIQANISRTQNYIITFHGDSSECKRKYEFPPWNEQLEWEIFLGAEQSIYIPIPDMIPSFSPGTSPVDSYTSFDQKKQISPLSFFFNGLEGNTIRIDKKCNHIIVRDCRNIQLTLEKGTVSGIDILKCHDCVVRAPLYNYTNIEYTSDADLFSTSAVNIRNEDMKIVVRNSQQIRFENIRLPVNMFSSSVFTQKNLP